MREINPNGLLKLSHITNSKVFVTSDNGESLKLNVDDTDKLLMVTDQGVKVKKPTIEVQSLDGTTLFYAYDPQENS